MIFLCAIIPISNLAVSLAYNGACAVPAVLLTLFLLPLLYSVKIPRIFLFPLCMASVVLRFCAVFQSACGALGNARSIIIAVLCIVAAGFAAYNGNAALRVASPLFFISALFAVYIIAVSLSESEFYNLSTPSAEEAVSVSVCTLSSCLALAGISKGQPQKRFKGAMCGVLVCAVLLLFKGARTEFVIISVPLATAVSAIEIKSVIGITAKNGE